jgi:hypothetical protein
VLVTADEAATISVTRGPRLGDGASSAWSPSRYAPGGGVIGGSFRNAARLSLLP